jgi:Cytochrome c7 and related cytochrome c
MAGTEDLSDISMRQGARGRLTTFLVAFLLVTFADLSSMGSASKIEAAPQRRSQTRPRKPSGKTQPQKPRIDYSKFSHRTHVEQQKLTCDSCHKFPSKNWKEARKGDEAFPDVTDFPEHQACLNCHHVQFFARERPAPAICSNCHVAVTPRNTARYPFPSLGEPFLGTKMGQTFVSEFKVLFPHDKHVDVVGGLPSRPRENLTFVWARASFNIGTRQDAQSKSCPVCHETYQPQGKSTDEFVTKPPKGLPEEEFWLKKGAFKTTPTTHAACANCHNEEAGIPPAPSDCAACHKFPAATTQPSRDFDHKLAVTMGINDWLMLRQWARRSAGRYRHEFDVHNELGCIACHNPAVMNTLEENTLVSVKSCGGSGGCHIETNTDGILNYEIEQKGKNSGFQCVKCHIILGKNPVPPNHLEAIPKPAAK